MNRFDWEGVFGDSPGPEPPDRPYVDPRLSLVFKRVEQEGSMKSVSEDLGVGRVDIIHAIHRAGAQGGLRSARRKYVENLREEAKDLLKQAKMKVMHAKMLDSISDLDTPPPGYGP